MSSVNIRLKALISFRPLFIISTKGRKCIHAVKIFIFLDLAKIISFPDKHLLQKFSTCAVTQQ